MKSRAVACLSLAILVGCDTGGSGGEPVTIRDSAGVSITENLPADSGRLERWTVEGPVVDIGSVEGEGGDALHRVAGARVLSDRRIVIANGGSGELRWFTESGQQTGSSGRQGAGPGEFKALGALVRGAGDTLFVYDPRARRVSVFAEDGQFIRAFQLAAGAAFAALLGRMNDGALVGHTTEFTAVEASEVESGVHRPTLHFLTFDASGSALDTIARYPGDERFFNVGDDRIEILTLPLGRRPSFAVSGAALYAATQESPEIRIVGPDGALRRIIRTGAEPRAVTPAHIEARIDALTEPAPPQLRDRIRTSYRAFPTPTTLAPYGTMHVDAEGNVWLADTEDPLAPSGGWTIYDSTGAAVARVVLPDAVRPLDIGADYILGLVRDDMDVEHVRLYRLVRPR